MVWLDVSLAEDTGFTGAMVTLSSGYCSIATYEQIRDTSEENDAPVENLRVVWIDKVVSSKLLLWWKLLLWITRVYDDLGACVVNCLYEVVLAWLDVTHAGNAGSFQFYDNFGAYAGFTCYFWTYFIFL